MDSYCSVAVSYLQFRGCRPYTIHLTSCKGWIDQCSQHSRYPPDTNRHRHSKTWRNHCLRQKKISCCRETARRSIFRKTYAVRNHAVIAFSLAKDYISTAGRSIRAWLRNYPRDAVTCGVCSWHKPNEPWFPVRVSPSFAIYTVFHNYRNT